LFFDFSSAISLLEAHSATKLFQFQEDGEKVAEIIEGLIVFTELILNVFCNFSTSSVSY
jgi:hypothetical protein